MPVSDASDGLASINEHQVGCGFNLSFLDMNWHHSVVEIGSRYDYLFIIIMFLNMDAVLDIHQMIFNIFLAGVSQKSPLLGIWHHRHGGMISG